MALNPTAPTGRERYLGADDIIVSKTDLKGHITYANRTFLEIAGYTEDEVLGVAHNLVRHPEMPRCVFAILWEIIQGGREVFAYVKNMAKSGDHYWVFAHVTPSFGSDGGIVGYHSNRRAPDQASVEAVARLYARLNRAEATAGRPKEQIARGKAELEAALAEAGMDYERFCFTVWGGRTAA